MGITVTQQADDWLCEQLTARGKGCGVRFGVKPAGCTGYEYVVEFVDVPNDDDIVVTDYSQNIYVDPLSMSMLEGMVVGFSVDGVNSGLDFTNPNVTAQCGCGKSFSV